MQDYKQGFLDEMHTVDRDDIKELMKNGIPLQSITEHMDHSDNVRKLGIYSRFMEYAYLLINRNHVPYF
jgi:hypothetical protein